MQDLIKWGTVATCGMVLLEMLFSTRGLVEWDSVRTELATTCPGGCR